MQRIMMEKELDKRWGWRWKSRKHSLSISGSSEGGSSPVLVKLFDEQEMARILQDQVRVGDEQMVDALHQVEIKHSEKEKVLNKKLVVANEKLNSALAEITIKDNLVKQHIKVAEEAIVGWEKAENEAAEFKLKLDDAIQRQLATEDHVKNLDGALKELMRQFHSGCEEHEKHLSETIVKKTREFDKVRLELESKLTEVSQSLLLNRTQLIKSQAENEDLNHALKDCFKIITELNDIKAHAETDNKIVQVRLEGLEKENFDLKYKIHTITKELEIKSAELEYGKKTSEVLSRHHAETVKKIVKLEDECNRLRMMVRKKLPSPATIIHMKQELDVLGKKSKGPTKPCRHPLFRSQSEGVNILSHELAQEEIQNPKVQSETSIMEANSIGVEQIANMDKEIQMLKEVLAKRNDELQLSCLMCAKTASRLTTMEDELENLRAAYSRLQPESRGGFEQAHEITTNGFDNSQYQHQIAGLEDALATKNRNLEVSNQMCEELSMKLTMAENQYFALQNQNATNEQSVIMLQGMLDRLLESQEKTQDPTCIEVNMQLRLELEIVVKKLFQAIEALVQVVEIKPYPKTIEDSTCGSIIMSLCWQDLKLDSCLNNLTLAANKLLDSHTHSISFIFELSSTLTCITTICSIFIKDLQKDRETICMHLESAKVEISQLEGILHKNEEERTTLEMQMQVEWDQVFDHEKKIEQLQIQNAEVINHVSIVELQLCESNDKVVILQKQLREAEILIAGLGLQQDQQKQEDELIEEELLVLSSSHPGRAKTMRATDAEMNELHTKLATLEVELHGKRRGHHDVVAKLEDLQEQIQRGIGQSTHLGGSQSKQPSIGEDDASTSIQQEREIASATLAECQHTILALGKQLKILGFSESRQMTLNATNSSNSIKKMTKAMELLRWQTESGDQGLDSKISLILESPTTTRRSVRTIRPFQVFKSPTNSSEVISNPNESLESNTATTYTRFYVESPLETSISPSTSNHDNS